MKSEAYKQQIFHLLDTTTMSYGKIARDVNCSISYVRNLARAHYHSSKQLKYVKTPSHYLVMKGVRIESALNLSRLKIDARPYEIDFSNQEPITEAEFDAKLEEIRNNQNEINSGKY